jgi:hypothetical protein
VANAVRAALPGGDILLANGYRNGEEYFAGTRVLDKAVSGVQAQGWLTNNAAALTVSQWLQNAQMVPDASQSTHPLLRYTCACPPGDTRSQLVFGLATYLLANTGRAFFDFQVGKTRDFQAWSPLYDLDLGPPLITHADIQQYFRDGVYERTYQRGLVVVNPSPKTVAVTLQRAYAEPDGTRVRNLFLTPHSAAILTSRPAA